jgi:hypothetical protein
MFRDFTPLSPNLFVPSADQLNADLDRWLSAVESTSTLPVKGCRAIIAPFVEVSPLFYIEYSLIYAEIIGTRDTLILDRRQLMLIDQ